jgi:hypothetical protein
VKGKGKAPAGSNTSTQPPTKTTAGPPTCGICLESFLITSNPATVSKGPTSSTRLSFGLRIPCPEKHAYCLKCLKSYLQFKLAEGNTGSLVFPVRCPECPIDAWSFEDEVAAKVLDGVEMVQWVRICVTQETKHIHHRDSIPKSYSILSLVFTVLTSTVLSALKSTTMVRKRKVNVQLVPLQYASPARHYGTVVSRVFVPHYIKLSIT